MNAFSTESIPVMTRTTVNFEPYVNSIQEERPDPAGRMVVVNIPRVENRGLLAWINSLVGSNETGFKDLGYEEFQWGETAQEAVEGLHTGLVSYATLTGDEEGQALLNAGKNAILSLVRSSVPAYGADVNDLIAVPTYSRLQRIETVLRWDQPEDNQVIAYVQFAADPGFTRPQISAPFVFFPAKRVGTYIKRTEGEAELVYLERVAAFNKQNNVADLATLLNSEEFKALSAQIYRTVFFQLQTSVNRYKNINLSAIMAGFDTCYPLIKAAASLT